MNFRIPDHDLDRFDKLTAAQKRDIITWLDILRDLHEMGGTQHAETVARNLVTKAGRGHSARTIRRKASHFRRMGWLALINESLASKQDKGLGLPQDFRDWFKNLVEGDGLDHGFKKIEPAWGEMMRRFVAGENIPGLGTWDQYYRKMNPKRATPERCPWSCSNPPPSLSYTQCYRIARRSKWDKARDLGVTNAKLAHIGIKLDLDSLGFLQEIHVDDFRTDFHIYDWDAGQICELWGVACIDVATRMILKCILIPRIIREDGAKQGISLNEVKTLLAGLLRDYGYPTSYRMRIVVENASAAISEQTESLLAIVSGGNIEVKRTSLLTGKELLGFADSKKGNPRAKIIETHWRYAWNRLANLPGHIGANYHLKPAEAQARFAQATKLLSAGAHLERAQMEAMLGGTVPSLEIAKRMIGMIWQQHAERCDHEMRGFEPFRAWRFRGSVDWHDATKTPLPAIIDPRQFEQFVETMQASESPIMKRDRLLASGATFAKLSPAGIGQLLSDSHLSVYSGARQFRVSLKNDRGRKEDYFYLCPHIHDLLRPGQKYLVRVDDEDKRTAYIFSADGGRFIGEVKERLTTDRDSIASVREAMAESEALAAGAIKDATRVPMDKVRKKIAMNQEIAEILTAPPARLALPDSGGAAPAQAAPPSRAKRPSGNENSASGLAALAALGL